MIKIFQMADLHLDSPFSGGDIRRGELGRKRLRELFCRMTSHIRSEGYDLVLIPGDLYDCGMVTEETAGLIWSELGSLTCPVVISPGNHDPYNSGSIYAGAGIPRNVHIFSEERISHIDIGTSGISVYGYAFTSSVYRGSPLSDVSCDPARINILCAHTEAETPLSPYAPIMYRDIENAGFAYAALGHVHKAPAPFRGSRCTAAYTGFAEGRAFDEPGEGGALEISLSGDGLSPHAELRRLSFSGYSFEVISLPVNGIFSSEELAEAAENELIRRGIGKNNAVRLVLDGVLPAAYTPSLTEIKRRCETVADYVEVKDKSIPSFDEGILAKDITIKGEFYRLMKARLDTGEADRDTAALALRLGLTALGGKELSDFLPEDRVFGEGAEE